jgi:hypothetical protein
MTDSNIIEIATQVNRVIVDVNNEVTINAVNNKVYAEQSLNQVTISALGMSGADGAGVASGGTTGQILAKNSNADFDTEWIAAPITEVNWGDIGGDLANQTDLDNALDEKLNSVIAGVNISVDNTDPNNPIINSLTDRYKTTSTTSHAIVSSGNLNFVVDVNLAYISHQEVIIAYDINNHMHGTVISYSDNSLTVEIKHKTGSGTYSNWNINLDGTPVDALTGIGNVGELAIFTASRVLGSTSAYWKSDGTSTALGDWDLGENNLSLTGTLELGDVTTDALIIGDIGGDARGVGSIDIQQSRSASDQVASGQDSTAFGRRNKVSSRNGIAIGEDNTVATSTYMFDPAQQQGICIGKANSVTAVGEYFGSYPIAIGRSNSVTNSFGVAVGRDCISSNTNAAALGNSTTASGVTSAAFGYACYALATNASAIGVSNNVSSTSSNGVAIGYSNLVAGSGGYALGNNVKCYASNSGSIGNGLTNTVADSLMVGRSTSFILIDSVGMSTGNNEKPNENIHAAGNILSTNTASLGANKITNGTFTGSATGWTVGSFAYSGNKITKTADGTTALTQTSAAMVTPLVVGETYLLQFTTSLLIAGSIVISCGGVTLGTISGSSAGSYSKTVRYIFKATSTANLAFTPSNDCRIITIDTVTLQKITGGDLIGLGSLYLGQDDTNRMQVSVSATGLVTLNANGSAAGFSFSDSITMADAQNIILNTTTGSKIGTATAQKLAFHDATPVIQRAGAAQAAVVATAATNITPYGFATAGQADGIVTLLNEIRAALVEKGIIKGSA